MYTLLHLISTISICFFFFFNDPATTEIYTLSLHDALPISFSHLDRPAADENRRRGRTLSTAPAPGARSPRACRDRKSTRLNSSHQIISYAVFCLKKKKKQAYRAQPVQTRC